MDFVKQVGDVLQALGIDPALAGLGIVLAVLLRYARGMVRWFNSEWTYALALLFGAIGAWVKSEGVGMRGSVMNGLALACIVLVMQKVIENWAKNVKFLPQDNQWT